MLMIREAQMAAFRAEREQSFVEAVEKKLVDQQLHVAGLPREQVRARVRDAVARARGHGLAAQSSVFRFVLLTFAVGPRFDEHPRILHALTSPESTPEARFAAVLEQTPDAIWVEAGKGL